MELEKLNEKIVEILELEKLFSDEEEQKLINRVKEIENSNINDIVEYEKTQKELDKIKRKFNAFDKENLTPLKKTLKNIADKKIGVYQKEHAEYVKKVKQVVEANALKKGIIFPSITMDANGAVEFIEKTKIEQANEMIEARLKYLSFDETKNESEIKFLKELLGVLK